ncbi:MAG: hypothetical protein QXG65_05880 [Thermoplasmata archaeon]
MNAAVRLWPGTDRPVSAIGWTIRPSDLRDGHRLQGLLRRSQSAGIDLIDLTMLPKGSLRERAFWAHAGAVGYRPSRAILSLTPSSSMARTRSASPRPYDQALERIREGLPPGTEVWIAAPVLAEDSSGEEATARAALSEATRQGTIDGWGVDGWAVDHRAGFADPMFIVTRLSLLHRDPTPPMEDRPRAWLVRDPLAGGLLDGSAIAERTRSLGGPPGQPPAPVRDLGEWLRPVTRLGPIVRRGSRTLAQSAIRWALDRPGVDAVLTPLPLPERFAEIIAGPTVPALTAEEEAVADLVYQSMPALDAPHAAGRDP